MGKGASLSGSRTLLIAWPNEGAEKMAELYIYVVDRALHVDNHSRVFQGDREITHQGF